MMRGKEVVECISALLFSVSPQASNNRGWGRMTFSAMLFERAFGARRGRKGADSNQQVPSLPPTSIVGGFLA